MRYRRGENEGAPAYPIAKCQFSYAAGVSSAHRNANRSGRKSDFPIVAHTFGMLKVKRFQCILLGWIGKVSSF